MADQVIELAGDGASGLGQQVPLFDSLLVVVETGLGSIADLVGFPLPLLAEGDPVVISTLTAIALDVPAVAQAISGVLTAGDVLRGAGLPLPREIVSSLDNLEVVFSGLPAERRSELGRASEQEILQKAAKTDQQSDVQQLLDAEKRKKAEKVRAGTLEAVAGIGIPVAAGGILTAVLADTVGIEGALAVGVIAAGIGTGISAILGAFD